MLEAAERVPESLSYLRDWFYELLGRSGVTMNGLAPLSYTTIWHWSKLTGNQPTAEETRALIRIDSAYRSPGAPKGAT